MRLFYKQPTKISIAEQHNVMLGEYTRRNEEFSTPLSTDIAYNSLL